LSASPSAVFHEDAAGLALHVGRYEELLQAADEPRRGPLDGRGSITKSGFAEFCRFFFDVCEQINFMTTLLDPVEFAKVVEHWFPARHRALTITTENPPWGWR